LISEKSGIPQGRRFSLFWEPAMSKLLAKKDKKEPAGSVAMRLQARVAEAAYLLWEKRGSGPGDEVDDWLQAELTLEDES
jgi:hypothetical protein